ncbi:hypothetical protein HY632_03845 [Candidatus Uhrbacteria bacterium]|nr:hypothetical protein [Candidatus Uhrbacteria bacterium]
MQVQFCIECGKFLDWYADDLDVCWGCLFGPLQNLHDGHDDDCGSGSSLRAALPIPRSNTS